MSSRTKSRFYPIVGVAVVVALLVTAISMTSQPPLAAADAAGPIKAAAKKEKPANKIDAHRGKVGPGQAGHCQPASEAGRAFQFRRGLLRT